MTRKTQSYTPAPAKAPKKKAKTRGGKKRKREDFGPAVDASGGVSFELVYTPTKGEIADGDS